MFTNVFHQINEKKTLRNKISNLIILLPYFYTHWIGYILSLIDKLLCIIINCAFLRRYYKISSRYLRITMTRTMLVTTDRSRHTVYIYIRAYRYIV